MMLHLVNPGNVAPQRLPTSGNDQLFGPNVANNLPGALRVLSLVQLCIGLAGALIITRPPLDRDN